MQASKSGRWLGSCGMPGLPMSSCCTRMPATQTLQPPGIPSPALRLVHIFHIILHVMNEWVGRLAAALKPLNWHRSFMIFLSLDYMNR